MATDDERRLAERIDQAAQQLLHGDEVRFEQLEIERRQRESAGEVTHGRLQEGDDSDRITLDIQNALRAAQQPKGKDK